MVQVPLMVIVVVPEFVILNTPPFFADVAVDTEVDGIVMVTLVEPVM